MTDVPKLLKELDDCILNVVTSSITNNLLKALTEESVRYRDQYGQTSAFLAGQMEGVLSVLRIIEGLKHG